MADLIAPHGGLREPVNCQVPVEQAAEFKSRLASMPRLAVSDADLSTLYRLGDGGLSPLSGAMDRATWQRVLDEEVIVHEGKKYAWTIPLAFPVEAGLASMLKPGQTAALVNGRNEVVGSLQVSEVYPWDKAHYVRSVYGTDRFDHPGGRMVQNDPRTHLVGGSVRVLPQKLPAEYGHLILSPQQTRALFRQRGFERVVAFQTRNPLHRAHEYALVAGLERLTRAGHFTGRAQSAGGRDQGRRCGRRHAHAHLPGPSGCQGPGRGRQG
jgi:sulfate adenylyltransferase